MAPSTIHVLYEPLHDCKACGGSCQGTFVTLLNDEEVERIEQIAAALGIAQPIQDQKMKMVGGRCPFLAEDGLCDIHRRYGLLAKPTLCRQYPLIAVRVAEGIRVGIDPGCYTGIQSWRTGPPIPDTSLVASSVSLPDGQEPFEESLLDLCDVENMSIAGMASALTGEPPKVEGGLPLAFAGRLIERLKLAHLDALLALPDTAPKMREALRPVAEAIETWDVENPPPWPALDEEQEAYALDVLQRMLYLRFCHAIPIVVGVALLVLAGVIAVGWSTDDRDEFGAGLAAWCRAMRAKAFWRSITPDAETMNWLARGPEFEPAQPGE